MKRGQGPGTESQAALPSKRRDSLGPGDEPPRVPFLDGIRGLAVLLVILHHGNKIAPTTPFDALLLKFTHSAWMGVDLFFVLSGFLITGILLDTKRSGHFFRSFYARRILRIFPLYYLTIFFFFYVFQPFMVPDNPDVLDLKRHQAWYWSYLSNVYVSMHGTWPRAYYLMHLWSVSIEEQFYMVWPAVVLLASRQRLKFICLCCIAATVLLRVLLMSSHAGAVPVYVSSATRLDGLALGALIATMIREPGEINLLVKNTRLAGMAGLAVLLGFAYFYGGINMTAVFDDSSIGTRFAFLSMTIGILAVSLVCGWLVVATLIASPRGMLVKILSGRVLRTFGKYSYCIYLWHLPFAFLLTEHFELSPRNFPLIFGSQIVGQTVYYAVLTGGSLIAAMLSWYLFEQPFLKLKRFFPYGTIVEPGRTAVPKPEARPQRADVMVAPVGK